MLLLEICCNVTVMYGQYVLVCYICDYVCDVFCQRHQEEFIRRFKVHMQYLGFNILVKFSTF